MYWGRVGPFSNMTGALITERTLEMDMHKRRLSAETGVGLPQAMGIDVAPRRWRMLSESLCFRFLRECGLADT